MLLKDLRLEKNLTQEEAANLIGISRRTYIKYENGEISLDSYKYKAIYNVIEQYGYLDETHGILSIDSITSTCEEIFSKYNVLYAFLFGSYAKGYATEKSDVDILISVDLTAFNFIQICGELQDKLHKNVDLLHESQLSNNMSLTQEILRDGIKIYGQHKER